MNVLKRSRVYESITSFSSLTLLMRNNSSFVLNDSDDNNNSNDKNQIIENTDNIDNNMKLTDFGFTNVPLNEKADLVKNVFESVAIGYDLANDVASFGMHRIWKRDLIKSLAPVDGASYLDVAGGTGDVAELIVDQMTPNNENHTGLSPTNVTILDINKDMLEAGKKRASETGGLFDKANANNTKIDFIQGNAENLESIKNESQDAYTISFGLRNVSNPDSALKEAYRVLKPGGRFLCLEFVPPEDGDKQDISLIDMVYRQSYDWYSFNILPKMAGLASGAPDSEAPYKYLVESIRRWRNPLYLMESIQKAGFSFVRYQTLSRGLVAIHSGVKL